MLNNILAIALISLLSACPVVRGTGNAIEATGEGVGEVVEGAGDGISHAVEGTGRAIGETGRELAH